MQAGLTISYLINQSLCSLHTGTDVFLIFTKKITFIW